PDLLGALLIFIAGILLAWLFKTLAVRLFRTINIDKYCDKTNISDLLLKGGIRERPSGLLGRLVLWFIVICFSILSLYSLNLPAVEHLLQKFLFYLPNVFAGLIIVLLGYLAGNFFARATLIGAVNAGWRSSGLVARAVKASIILFALTMALEQVGIGPQTTAIAFAILFGGIVLAFAIAFGFGARGIARSYLEEKMHHPQKPDTFDHL
ncbi:MAG TPA: hypothetical protein DCR97_07670, partial [Deltaproteobacteria bacterium]|nr:hypothetical protein [Deltaproteobacteria bacterium]